MRHINIIAKTWKSKKRGITYHSVKFQVDSGKWYYDSYRYGGGEQYLASVKKNLIERGIICDDTQRIYGLHTYCDGRGIKLDHYVHSVNTKKDLGWYA